MLRESALTIMIAILNYAFFFFMPTILPAKVPYTLVCVSCINHLLYNMNVYIYMYSIVTYKHNEEVYLFQYITF